MYRVIIVDDEAIIRQGLKKIIERFCPAWEIVGEAEDGVAGLQQVFRHQPDLVILDFRMPGLNGLECCEQIAAKSPQIHRVILTAYQDFQIAKQAIQHGVTAFITKPLDRAELLDTLERVGHAIEQDRLDQAQLLALQSSLQQMAPFAQRLYYQQFLYGHDIGDLERLMHTSGFALPIQSGDDQVIVLSLNPDWIEKDQFTSFDIELFLYALSKYVQEWYSTQSPHVVLQDHVGQIVIIHLLNAFPIEDRPRQAIAIAERLRRSIRQAFKRSVTIGISMPCSLSNTPQAYQEASLAVTYRFVQGGDKVITAEDLQKRQALPLHMLAMIDQALEHIMQGHGQDAYVVLETLISAADISPTELNHAIVHFMLKLAVQIKQMDWEVDESSGRSLDGWLKELETTTTRDSLLQRLQSMLNALSHFISQQRNQIPRNAEERAMKYVRDYLGDGVCLQSVADYMGMNASYFSRWFKYATNQNFVDFLKQCRIERAVELLQQTDLALSEISSKIGYTDVKHFYRVFKDMIGLTPSEYRKQLGG